MQMPAIVAVAPVQARSPFPLARDTPDHVADVVRHQYRAVGADRHSHRSSVCLPFVRREEARQDIACRSDRPPICEWYEDKLVATQRAAIPGTVLSDGHAIRKAGKRAGRQPAEAE